MSSLKPNHPASMPTPSPASPSPASRRPVGPSPTLPSQSIAFYIITLTALSITPATHAQLTDPIPDPIPPAPLRINLTPLATGLASPSSLLSPNDNTNRLFVADQTGQIRLIDHGSLSPAPALDLSSRLVSLNPNYDERGLLGLAFDPDFTNPLSPGYHKLYTYTSEPLTPTADFTVPMPPGTPFNNQSVIAQWQISNSNPNLIDPASRREILRIDHPAFNHNGGMLAFGPDRMLYISTGDGGAANDVGAGHNPLTGNAQDLTTVLGKILRIDVRGSNSANHQYGIPADNPYATAPSALPEIYASGLRNPFRFSFDHATGDLIAADVGQNNIEEVNRIVKGGNYGWHYKEGTFKFNPADGTISTDLTGLPSNLIDPILQYDHTEGIAIIGGFVYHGKALPQLAGKYIFGDLSLGFSQPNGRLFSADLATGQIQELLLGPDGHKLNLFIKGLGEDPNGELYVLASSNLGPSGTTGTVYQIVPEPEALALLSLFTTASLLRRPRSPSSLAPTL